MQVFSVQEPTPLIGEHNIPIWKNSGAVKRLWRPQWSAQRQRRCKYRSLLWISSATTNRLLHIRVKKISRRLSTFEHPDKPSKKKTNGHYRCEQFTNPGTSRMSRSWVEPSTTTWGTKIQCPRVAFVFLGKGISAQHATNTRDDATKHRSQQKPPETNGWVFQAATVQVICHPLRSHTPDIVHVWSSENAES